jgi:hypothetical protein
MRHHHALGLLTIMLGGSGCRWDYTPTDNELPPPPAQSDEGTESESDGEGPPLGETGETPPLGETGESPPPGETGEPAQDMPASYRIDCLDIQRLGDADHTVFQVATLQSVWTNDIDKFKLNILIDLLGTDTIAIRSGIGTGWSDQCAHQETASAEFPVAYQPMVTEWAPSDADGICATVTESGGAGTYAVELRAEDRIYIYAEDNDGTAFNCSLDAGDPDAIPISALSATISSTADGSALAGTMTGCMTRADADGICSCLSVCAGNQHPDCPGCPGGALPLGVLLGGIFTTPHCTELLGEPAFDVELEFSARRLSEVPQTCG